MVHIRKCINNFISAQNTGTLPSSQNVGVQIAVSREQKNYRLKIQLGFMS